MIDSKQASESLNCGIITDMLSHEEMIGLQAEKHELTDENEFETAEQFVLHLMHCAAYLHALRVVDRKSVLDLGCNSGYGTNILATRAQRVVGLDVSARAIALAQSRHKGANIEFKVIDGVRIPFEDNSFRVITCFQLIEHLVEYDAFMSEVKRVLEPDGIAIFTTPNALLRLDPGMKPWNPFHVREFDAEGFEGTLEQHFEHVLILALYGREPVHRIVADRADRIRRSARARASTESTGTPGHALLRAAKALLPAGLVAIIAGRGAPEDQGRSLQLAKDEYSPDYFFYQTGGLTTALEFMAICSADDVLPWAEPLSDRD